MRRIQIKPNTKPVTESRLAAYSQAYAEIKSCGLARFTTPSIVATHKELCSYIHQTRTILNFDTRQRLNEFAQLLQRELIARKLCLRQE